MNNAPSHMPTRHQNQRGTQVVEQTIPKVQVADWKVAGLVLCGGASRRMGRAKASLPFGNESILSRIVRLVSEVAERVLVARRPGQSLPDLPPGVPVVEDLYPGQGPLAGIHAGLEAVRGHASHLLVVSCDVPLIKVEFMERLVEAMRQAIIAADSSDLVPKACVPVLRDQRHPLVAVYAVEVLPLVEELLCQGRLRPAFLLEQISVRWLASDQWADIDPESVSLTNINTPEEYLAALRHAGFNEPPSSEPGGVTRN